MQNIHLYTNALSEFRMCVITKANVMKMPESSLFVFQNLAFRVDSGGHGVLWTVCVSEMSLIDPTQLPICTSPVITHHNNTFAPLSQFLFHRSNI